MSPSEPTRDDCRPLTHSAVDPKAFRSTAGQFLTGVTIVTTLDRDGNPQGITANSFTSVSLDPPLILICIGKSSRSYPDFLAAKAFAVNVLSAEQRSLSVQFASGTKDRFAGTSWSKSRTECPIFPGSLATFDCVSHQTVDAGDHVILIGRVVEISRTGGIPLGYFSGSYLDFAVEGETLETRSREHARFGALLRQDELLLFVQTENGLSLPFADTLVEDGEGGASLIGQLRALGVEASLSFAYSVFSDDLDDRLYTIYLGDITEIVDPLPPGLVLLAPDEIPFDSLGRLRGLVQRYIRERAQDVYGLYVGTMEKGIVHRLPPSRSG